MAREDEPLGPALSQLDETLARANRMIAKLTDAGLRVEVNIDYSRGVGRESAPELSVAAYKRL